MRGARNNLSASVLFHSAFQYQVLDELIGLFASAKN